jgi:hypothetical protein
MAWDSLLKRYLGLISEEEKEEVCARVRLNSVQLLVSGN